MKIKVPEGMLEAATESWETTPHTIEERCKDILEAALLWLSEHPIVPTDDQIAYLLKWADEQPIASVDDVRERWLMEWQRRIFQDPEPEVPKAIKDLLWDESIDRMCARSRANADIIEAYNRGRKSV